MPMEMANPIMQAATAAHHRSLWPRILCPSLKKKIRKDVLTAHKLQILRMLSASVRLRYFSSIERKSAGGFVAPISTA